MLIRSPQLDADRVAAHLASLALSGRRMPPAWDGARASGPVIAANGLRLGHMLHGRGLLLDADLKDFGINRKLRHVIERTPMMRRLEALTRRWGVITADGPILDRRTGAVFDPERMAVRLVHEPMFDGRQGIADRVLRDMAIAATANSYDGIVNARGTGLGNDLWIGKASLTTTANDWYGMMRAAGSPPAMTFNSTTAPTQSATDRATTGAWSLGIPSPSGGRSKYLLTLGMHFGQTVNQVVLGDVHVQGGSFRLTVTTAETVAAPVTITRQYFPLGPLGSGTYMVSITTTGASATATNLTVTYVDQDNNAAQTTVIVGPATATIADECWPDSSAAAGPMPFWALASGDYGVRSMSQTQSSVALAAGAIAVLLFTPRVWMPGLAANVYVERDSTIQIDGLAELVGSTTGCLNALVQANTTSLGVSGFFMRTVEA